MRKRHTTRAQFILSVMACLLLGAGILILSGYVVCYATQISHNPTVFVRCLFLAIGCITASLLCDAINSLICDIKRAQRARRHIAQQEMQIQIEAARRFRDIK